jgi:hypothetical protein
LSGVCDQIFGPSPATAAPALGTDHGGHLLKGLGLGLTSERRGEEGQRKNLLRARA